MSLQAVTSSDFHPPVDIELKNIFALKTRVLSDNSSCHCHNPDETEDVSLVINQVTAVLLVTSLTKWLRQK